MPLRNLRAGTAGVDVKALQEALNAWGADPQLATDGQFGRLTGRAVREFQAEHDLAVDGIVGRHTRRKLFPVGVATTTIYGLRLRMPELPPFRGGYARQWPGPLTLDPPAISLASPLYKATRFPGLIPWLAAPQVPDWGLSGPPFPGRQSSEPIRFEFDHVELQPGAQSTFPFNGARQDAFVLTMQNVYRRGPDDGAHQELALGVQIGTSVTDLNGGWTVNPFVQLTDVDRLAAIGGFHFLQPYAAAGVQFTGLGNPQPSLTGSLFPVNLGLDIGEMITVSFAGGITATLNLLTGQVQAGPQLSFGLTLKLGKPNTPLF